MDNAIQATKAGCIMDNELDMQRLGEPEVRTFKTVVTDMIIWLRQGHRVFKHPRRSIDFDHQEFRPGLRGTL